MNRHTYPTWPSASLFTGSLLKNFRKTFSIKKSPDNQNNRPASFCQQERHIVFFLYLFTGIFITADISLLRPPLIKYSKTPTSNFSATPNHVHTFLHKSKSNICIIQKKINASLHSLFKRIDIYTIEMYLKFHRYSLSLSLRLPFAQCASICSSERPFVSGISLTVSHMVGEHKTAKIQNVPAGPA